MKTNTLYNLVLFSNLFWGLANGIYGPLYAIFVKNMGGGLIDIGIAYSILLILQGVLMIPFGELTDRYGRKRFAIVSGLLFAFGAFLYAFWATNVLSVFIIQIILGVGTAMSIPSWSTLMFDACGKKGKNKKYGALMGGTYVCQGIASIAGAAIVAYTSFSALFVIMGFLVLVSTVLMFLIKFE